MGNEITRAGKIIAGLLLILFTSAAIVIIIGYWPDRLPAPGSKSALYSGKIFHVKLLDSVAVTINSEEAASVKKNEVQKDSVHDVKAKDSGKVMIAKDSPRIENKSYGPRHQRHGAIDLNLLLLILVATGGFLGNMIHISTSFTTFIGAEKFKKSWILWYCVKPFTASALSITLYFAFRAGFLNSSSDATNINLYGVMTLAIMAGLFTDIATEKLKEIFQVAFRPKDERPNKLNPVAVVISEINPDSLDKGKENIILIKGTGLDQSGLAFKINSEVVGTEPVQPSLITIKYTVPPSQATATSFKIEVFNTAGEIISSKDFKVV